MSFSERPRFIELPADVPLAKKRDWMLLGDSEGVVIDVTSDEALDFLGRVRRLPAWDYLLKDERRMRTRAEALVVVFGPSASGKDTVCDEISSELGACVTQVSTDWYYGPFGRIQGAHRPNIYANNYDHPHSVDWQLLRLHLGMLKEGYRARRPVYDFSTHCRTGEYQVVEPRPVVLVSGIMAGYELGQEADLVIAVDAPFDVCMERRVGRDVRERGRREDQCWQQIEETVEPGYREFVEPFMQLARGRWFREGRAVVVDNSCNARTWDDFPAVANSGVYLEPLEDLLRELGC